MHKKEKKITTKLDKNNVLAEEQRSFWLSYAKGRIIISVLIVIVLLFLIFN